MIASLGITALAGYLKPAVHPDIPIRILLDNSAGKVTFFPTASTIVTIDFNARNAIIWNLDGHCLRTKPMMKMQMIVPTVIMQRISRMSPRPAGPAIKMLPPETCIPDGLQSLRLLAVGTVPHDPFIIILPRVRFRYLRIYSVK